jgi:hypothetical protein
MQRNTFSGSSSLTPKRGQPPVWDTALSPDISPLKLAPHRHKEKERSFANTAEPLPSLVPHERRHNEQWTMLSNSNEPLLSTSLVGSASR